MAIMKNAHALFSDVKKGDFFFEVKRKIFHIFLTAYPLYFIFLENWREISVYFSIILLCIWFLSEFLRLKFGIENTPTGLLTKAISRNYRINKSNSWREFKQPAWIIGNLIILILFNGPVLISGILVLSIGDSAAGLVGMFFKDKIFSGKTVQGFLAGVVASFLVVGFFTGDFRIALGSSVFGMAAEALSYKINDNYIIGLFSCIGAIFVSAI